MSPRAACRLAELGFEQVHDYVGGKADWLARGMPLEGERPPRTAASLARPDVARCGPRDRLDELGVRIERSPYEFGVVTGPEGVVLGRLEGAAAAGGGPAAAAAEPGPWSVRPSARLDWLAERMDRRGVDSVLVTTPEGRLVGVVRRADLP
jgi:hypothetical protein